MFQFHCSVGVMIMIISQVSVESLKGVEVCTRLVIAPKLRGDLPKLVRSDSISVTQLSTEVNN